MFPWPKLLVKVNANVKAGVVPIRMMIAAPLAIRVHSCDVVIDLAAVLAVSAGVPIDSGAIRLEPAMTIVLPIPIGASGPAES